MISFEQARAIVLKNVNPLTQQRVRLEQARGLVLARPAKARHPLPPFDQSAMDGYAVRRADCLRATAKRPVGLQLIGTIYAGDLPRGTVKPGTTIKVMTGAAIPRGADAVVKREFCDEVDGDVAIKKKPRAGEHVRYQGAEFAKGKTVLEPGTRITPPVVGLLAACGYASVYVRRKPRVSLLVAGNELVEPGGKLRRGQIYDSNSYALAAALADMGLGECEIEWLRDDQETLRKHIRLALDSTDVLLTSGGVSVGDRDFLKGVFEDLGVRTIFWRVATKPGKPIYFGVFRSSARKVRQTLVFGIPGNPVSALISFHQFVKPALYKTMGQTSVDRFCLTAVLAKRCRKKAGRLEWVRGRLATRKDVLVVYPTRGQDSHMLGGLAQADCLIEFPAGATDLPRGRKVRVELLDWSK